VRLGFNLAQVFSAMLPNISKWMSGSDVLQTVDYWTMPCHILSVYLLTSSLSTFFTSLPFVLDLTVIDCEVLLYIGCSFVHSILHSHPFIH
jgi:hypothetical protein